MSQVIFSTIDPSISGTDLASTLDDFKDAVVSGFSGTTRPTELDPGGFWVDTTNNPTSWAFRLWTGTTDVTIFTINLTTGVGSVSLAVDSFIVKKISADTVGAVLDLVKRRIASNGQVLNGDVVGEIHITGRTNTSGNPVVAKIVFTASDDMTSSAYGGELEFWSTPDASATITKHMRFVDGLIETILPHKLNSQILVSQDVATSATIAQLSATKVLVEMTGSTTTSIQGLNSTHASKVVTIHNRSSAVVTLKHQDAGATAADRIKLPNSTDIAISAEGAATLFYCTTDSRWKIQSTSEKVTGVTTQTFYGATESFTVPATVTKLKVTAFRKPNGFNDFSKTILDVYGNAYSWGRNDSGQGGLGDITPRSSPVAVLGGLSFDRIFATGDGSQGRSGIVKTGGMYAWGENGEGQLGVGDQVSRSSPVAVLGGFNFSEVYSKRYSVWALTPSGAAYAWGRNDSGELGVGNVASRSSPVAVLGGLFFSKLAISGASFPYSAMGLDPNGTAYAWGHNGSGQLGVGNVAARSSPVAVLGGLTFKDIVPGGEYSTDKKYYLGLTTAGAAYAWGDNTYGQLGLGDVTPRSSPVAVLGGLTFVKLFTANNIENGTMSSYGMTSDGTLYAWGRNTNGQLGVGNVASRSSPVAVLGGLKFVNLQAAEAYCHAIQADGTLYAWGANAGQQLGTGDTTPRSSPVAVVGGLKFADFYHNAFDLSSYGITKDGLFYAWGDNSFGNLADGTVSGRSSPTRVIGTIIPDSSLRTQSLDLTVTAGASYTVKTGVGFSSFGNALLLRGAYKVEVEYKA